MFSFSLNPKVQAVDSQVCVPVIFSFCYRQMELLQLCRRTWVPRIPGDVMATAVNGAWALTLIKTSDGPCYFCLSGANFACP